MNRIMLFDQGGVSYKSPSGTTKVECIFTNFPINTVGTNVFWQNDTIRLICKI